jgi:hypothetical protein
MSVLVYRKPVPKSIPPAADGSVVVANGAVPMNFLQSIALGYDMMVPVQPRRAGRWRQRTLGSSSRLAVASTTMLAKYWASSLAGLGIPANAPDGSR